MNTKAKEADFPVFTWIENRYGIRLNRRGRLVVGWAIFIGFLAVWALADYITTPEACRVPFEEMSQGCKDLLYP